MMILRSLSNLLTSGKKANLLMKKKAVIVHSGGMDSSLCLALAIQEFGASEVLSLSFTYNQRHSVELGRARRISQHFNVDHVEVNLNCLSELTESALIGNNQAIEHNPNQAPNTLVVGRNGLMARLGGHSRSILRGKMYLYGSDGTRGSELWLS